jgi:serine/threonine protein kinase
MELCPGGSISTVLASFGCLSTNIVRRYTYQIMAGLGYLHRHSIVHRDIKTGMKA